MDKKGASRIFTNNVSEMKYGLHFAKVATGELAFMRGYMCAVKPRQMSEFTKKNAQLQKNEYFFVKMIDSSIKYMATKKAYIWNIRNLESGRNLTKKFKKCPVSDL